MIDSVTLIFSRFTEYRSFSVIALFQSMTILAGWMITAGQLKLLNYPSGRVMWNPCAVFVRNWGPFFLLLPVVWVILALYLDDRFANTTPRWVWIGSGIALWFLIVCILWSTTTNPGHIPGPF